MLKELFLPGLRIITRALCLLYLSVWEESMHGLSKFTGVSALLLILLAFSAALAKPLASPADDRDTVAVIYKDGHRQSLAMAEIARIDFKAPASIVFKDGHREKLAAEIDRIEFGPSEVAITPGRGHFVGKWEVGQGNGGSRFFITLDADGGARKSIGSSHGTWTLVDGEARISWDDGWHDVIRKVGATHEKRAYEPGRSFDETPSNVTAARNTQAKPI
jgi:hypothetical protein